MKGSVRSFSARFAKEAAAAFLVAATLVALAPSPRAQESASVKFNKKGNILISDQFNNRVIEIAPDGSIVRQFGNGSSTAGNGSFVAPNDAQRVGSLTLIACTGAPPGSEPSCPNGCPDNRVVLVNPKGKIVWQYGQAGVTGSGANQLNAPVQATYLPNNHVLITDQGNHRVIEVSQKKNIVWQQGQTGVAGSGFNQLNDPNSAELLSNGNILIADEGNNRVVEVDRQYNIVWQADVLGDSSSLNAPAFASRLPDGNTLVSDGGNNRIVEVAPDSTVAWSYITNTRPGSVDSPAPSRAVRLANGATLISDQFNDQVLSVDQTRSPLFSYGTIAVAGSGPGQLNAPYDAKVIGDYTGLTKPPAHAGGGMGSGGSGGGSGGGY